jgi:hypothetical protein
MRSTRNTTAILEKSGGAPTKDWSAGIRFGHSGWIPESRFTRLGDLQLLLCHGQHPRRPCILQKRH